MNMRNFILVIAAAVVIACSGVTAEDAVLKFKVEDPTASEVVVVCHSDVKVLPLDSLGYAETVMSGEDAAYARVFYGRESMWIYFEDGDVADISFNGRDFTGTFLFEGEKSGAVSYLNDVKLTALPDEDYALPFEEFYSKILAKEKDALRLLDANGLGDAGNFEEVERGRIRYSYGAPLLMHPIGHRMMTGDMQYMPDEEYYRVIDSYVVENEMWGGVDEYRGFIIEAAHVLDAENRNVTALYPKTVAQMKFIAGRFENSALRAQLLHFLAASYVDNYGINDIQELESIYNTYVKDSTLVADYNAKYEKWDLSRPGKPSPDFKAPDIDGREWTLSDFKGKYVYIDMWATWCNPCKREIPFLRNLEEKFADAQIAFVGLSTDRDRSKWEEMVRSGVLAGVQLYLGPQSSFQKAYNIDGIPRFILLDKEGRIISNDMSRPSSDDTVKMLESLDGIR